MNHLEEAMKRYGVSVWDIAKLLGCSERTVRNKMSGITGFTYEEVKKIRDSISPGMNIEYLFATENDNRAS